MERFRRLSLCQQKFRFLARRPPPTEDSVRAGVRLLRRKAEQLVLAGPLRRQVGEASNAHAVGEPTIDGRFDEIGRKESQRDCHVDLSRERISNTKASRTTAEREEYDRINAHLDQALEFEAHL